MCAHWLAFIMMVADGQLLNKHQALSGHHADSAQTKLSHHINGLVQERCNSSALAMELRLSCTNP